MNDFGRAFSHIHDFRPLLLCFFCGHLGYDDDLLLRELGRTEKKKDTDTVLERNRQTEKGMKTQ